MDRWLFSTSERRTGGIISMSSFSISAPRLDMFLKIFSRPSATTTLSALARSSLETSRSSSCMLRSSSFRMSSKVNMSPRISAASSGSDPSSEEMIALSLVRFIRLRISAMSLTPPISFSLAAPEISSLSSVSATSSIRSVGTLLRLAILRTISSCISGERASMISAACSGRRWARMSAVVCGCSIFVKSFSSFGSMSRSFSKMGFSLILSFSSSRAVRMLPACSGPRAFRTMFFATSSLTETIPPFSFARSQNSLATFWTSPDEMLVIRLMCLLMRRTSAARRFFITDAASSSSRESRRMAAFSSLVIVQSGRKA